MKKLHLICNSHIDPVWMWDWEEGLGTAISTFYQAAEFCDEYDYIFCHNEAILYEFIEQYDPVLFTRIQKLVKEGKWHIMGGWYLQPDCNIPSGEAFVRQIKLGREYFWEKFGKRPTVAVNFDSFGHTVGLVQILRKCGFEGNIICRPMRDLIDLPGDVFTWVGKDGSKIKVWRSDSDSLYTTSFGNAVRDITEKVSRFPEEDTVMAALWGVGNHGGNPSRKDFAALKIYQKEAPFQVVHSTPEQFFAEVSSKGEYDKSMPCLVGAYTSMNRIKQKQMELETKLFTTEKLCAIAGLNGTYTWDDSVFHKADVALSSVAFHDVLSGTCTQEGEISAIRKADSAIELLTQEFNKAFFSICSRFAKAGNGEYPVFVYNAMPYARKTQCEVEFLSTKTIFDIDQWENVVTVWQNGKAVASQCIHELSNISYDRRKRISFVGELAPLGVTRFDITVSQREKVERKDNLEEDIVVNTPYGKVTIGRNTGLMESFLVNGREMLRGGGFQPVMYDDTADPWGFDMVSIGTNPVPFALSKCDGGVFDNLKNVRVIEDGDVLTQVESLFELGRSTVRACYKIYKDLPYVDVQWDVLWNERLKTLKIQIPTALTGGFIGQIPFGTEEMPQDGSERMAHRFVGIQQGEQALAVYNDSTYGFSCQDSTIHTTLLRGVAYCAHPIGNNPLIDDDRYIPSVEEGRHSFRFRIAYNPVSQLENKAAEFMNVPYALNYFPHGQKPAGETLENQLIIENKEISLVAFYQDGDRYVLRLLNNQEKQTTAEILLCGANYTVTFGKYEVKTLCYTEGKLQEQVYIC